MYIVDDQWGESMNTPKTRGLKQFLNSLKMYNNNAFLDGKRLEMSHIVPKWFLNKLNNHKGDMKFFQSKRCFQMLSLIYILNGGRWGKDWKFSIGESIPQLKHPCKPTEPHPFIQSWLIPQPKIEEPKIIVGQLFSPHIVEREYWLNLFNYYQDEEFLQRLMQYYDLKNLTYQDIIGNPQWSLRKIKSFTFNDSFKSFETSFVEKTKKILVIIDDKYVMESSELIQVTYNYESVCMMRGQYWRIHTNLQSEQWCNDEYNTMDWIYSNEIQNGWNFLINITEPIFLIHECLLLKQEICKKIPQEFRPVNVYDWVQNMLYYSNRIHEYLCQNPQHKFEHPCGPKYTCKKHTTTACTQCITNLGVYSSKTWNIEWCCNHIKNPKQWILDSKNGLCMTAMKNTR